MADKDIQEMHKELEHLGIFSETEPICRILVRAGYIHKSRAVEMVEICNVCDGVGRKFCSRCIGKGIALKD